MFQSVLYASRFVYEDVVVLAWITYVNSPAKQP